MLWPTPARNFNAARWACFAAALLLWGSPAAADKLVPLVQGLKWSAVSSLIGYQGRLWFANSVKFVNHNSADLYSYDPQTGKSRYEAHLFSQDAGEPVVYWPFEDARFSPGFGEFMVTNGTSWGWHVLPEGRAFHTHAMAVLGGTLYAASSAWRARLLRSRDGGGQLWGLKAPKAVPAGPIAGRLPQTHAALPVKLEAVLGQLDKALAAPRLTRGFRRLLVPLARSGATEVGEALAERLNGPYGATSAARFAGRRLGRRPPRPEGPGNLSGADQTPRKQK